MALLRRRAVFHDQSYVLKTRTQASRWCGRGAAIVLILYGGGGSINLKGTKFDVTTHFSLSGASSPTATGSLACALPGRDGCYYESTWPSGSRSILPLASVSGNLFRASPARDRDLGILRCKKQESPCLWYWECRNWVSQSS